MDLVDVTRVRGLLERRPAARQRLFTAQELACCADRRDPVPRLAARFAAKEAVGKAIGSGVVVWREIEVLGGGTEVPLVHLHGATAAAARRLGIARIEVSLSHTASYAVAVAAALTERP